MRCTTTKVAFRKASVTTYETRKAAGFRPRPSPSDRPTRYQQIARQLFQPLPGGSQVVVQRDCACDATIMTVSAQATSKIFSMTITPRFGC